MLNKHIHVKLFTAGVLFTAFGLSSCVDNNYDLDNVDMKLGSNVDLTLPTSSTGEIQLKNIIDLKEDGVVQLVDNPNGGGKMYAVCEDGKANTKPLKIDEIKMTPKLGNFDSWVNLSDKLVSDARRNGPRKAEESDTYITVHGYEINLGKASYQYELDENDASTSIDEAKAEKVSDDLLSVTNIKCTDNSITMHLELKDMFDHFRLVHLDNFFLNLPKELHISSCTIDGTPIKSLKNHNDEKSAMQRLSLTEVDEDGHSMQTPLELALTFNSADIHTLAPGETDLSAYNVVYNPETHEVEFTGDIFVEGTFRLKVNDKDMDLDKVAQILERDMTIEQALDAKTNGVDLTDYPSVIPQKLHFFGENEFKESIVIEKVSGRVKHAVDDIEPVKLDDMPDFLNDPDVVLDLDNPMVFVSTSSTLPAKAATAITLVGTFEDQTTVERHTKKDGSEDERVVFGEGSKVFMMANPDKKDNKMYVPEKYAGVELQYLPLYTGNDVPTDVTGLLKRIPKQIDVEADDVLMEAVDFDITKEYEVNVEYQVFAPLSFGPEFMLVYQDTEDDLDLGDDLDDVEFSQDAFIEVTADVVSTLPTRCSLTITPLNKEAQVLNVLKPIELTVDGGKTTPIKVALVPTQGHSLNEALHSGATQLDGIKYRAVLDKAVPGGVLSDSGSIVLKNMKLKIKSSISIDAN